MGPENTVLALLLLVIVSRSCGVVAKADGYSCIAIVAQRYIRANSTVALIKTHAYSRQQPVLVNHARHSAEDRLVQLLENNTAFSIVISGLTVKHKKKCYSPRKLAGDKPVDYFIIVGRYDEVSRCVRSFRFGKLTDDRGQFVVFLESETTNASEKVKTVLEIFEERQQLRAVVLVANKQQSEIDIYTRFPLDKTPHMKIVNKCDGHSLRNGRPLFQSKLPSNMYGKKVKIGVGSSDDWYTYTCNRIGGGYAGLETEIVGAMASTLNFFPVYLSKDDLEKQRHLKARFLERSAGSMEVLKYRTLSGGIDIAIGGYSLEPNITEEFGFTFPYLRDTAHFFVTRDLILYNNMELWTKQIILQLVSIHICASLTLQLLKQRVQRRPVEQRSAEQDAFGTTCTMVWSLLTGLPGNVSNLSSSRQLLLWVAYAFLAINMNVAYRSLLTSLLARPLYLEKIQTFGDLAESGLPYWPFFNLKVLFQWENERITREQLHQFLSTQPECNIGRCGSELLSTPQHVLSASFGTIKIFEFLFPKRSYHIVDKTKIGETIDYAMYTSRNFFLYRKMTTMIHRSAQAGLIDYWNDRTLRDCDFTGSLQHKLLKADYNRSVFEKHPEDTLQPLSFALLEYPLRILGLGLGLAGLVFIWEIACSTQKSRFTRACSRRRGWISGCGVGTKPIHCKMKATYGEEANVEGIVT